MKVYRYDITEVDGDHENESSILTNFELDYKQKDAICRWERGLDTSTKYEEEYDGMWTDEGTIIKSPEMAMCDEMNKEELNKLIEFSGLVYFDKEQYDKDIKEVYESA